MPVLPVRNNLRRPNSSHFPQSSRSFQFRKGLASKCSWKCTAIVFIILCVVLTAALTYMFGEYDSASCFYLCGDAFCGWFLINVVAHDWQFLIIFDFVLISFGFAAESG